MASRFSKRVAKRSWEGDSNVWEAAHCFLSSDFPVKPLGTFPKPIFELRRRPLALESRPYAL